MDEKRCFVWAMSAHRHVTSAGSDRIVKLLESSKTVFQNKKSKIYFNFLSTQRITFSEAPRLDAKKRNFCSVAPRDEKLCLSLENRFIYPGYLVEI